MPTRIVVVEEAFVARGRGVLVSPRFSADDARAPFTELAKAPSSGFRVRLELPPPDARAVVTRAALEVSHIRGALAPYAMIRLLELSPEDVPRGTEIWLDDR